MRDRRTGRCLCEAVRFEAELASPDIKVCHCSICRKWSGSPTIFVRSKGGVAIENEANVSWYQSSEWAERGFCKICGSNLFFRLREGYGDFYNVSVGALDDSSGLKMAMHIYIDEKPDYYDFADECPRLTGKEFLAAIEAERAETN